MPYKDRSSLPDNVKNVLPAHAQDIYMAAFNSARMNIKIRKSVGATNRGKRWRTKWPGRP